MYEACLDCDAPSIFGNTGNGKCSNCYGAGEKSGYMDAIIPSLKKDNPEQCPVCDGTGVCQTCQGDGYLKS